MKNIETLDAARRKFLRAFPAAAAAGLPLAEVLLHSPLALAQAASQPDAAIKFQIVSNEEFAENVKTQQANPGAKNPYHAKKNLHDTKSYTVDLMTEKDSNTKEFEWHEDRDHVVQVLEGTATYELGGTPQGSQSTGPGQWLAPSAVGATTVTVKKGDTLFIPSGMLHRHTSAVMMTVVMFTIIQTSPATAVHS